MALRRFAHENRTMSSPRNIDSNGPQSSLTPRSRPSYGLHRSPADTPSISSSVPFDWEAARSMAPPPYATPSKSRGRKSLAVGTGTPTASRKAVVRKKGIIERIRNIPSNIAFELSLFPQNIPLPTPKTSARILGGAVHVVHFFILATHDNEDGWDSISGTKRSSWFDWSTPITLLFIAFSIFNVYNLCTRTRSYKFHRRNEPLASPHAKFVVTSLDLEPLQRPTFKQRVRADLWYSFSYFWRFLFGLQPPKRTPPPKEKTSRVQELEVWEPSEMELELFGIYSPAHALLWISMGSSNWLYSVLIMVLMGLQLNALTHAFIQLLKDKQILASETMKEYNDVFVYPRVNPIRRDVAVMTHQSEVVSVWEE
ncbi:hypothetical protein CPB84DRAFT_1776689 [Gymnopilus junonius]|uniref:Uncharacterized protein n=1 Tax=Gymnopilus junonius TaxID=109634 RepID=A0A9P5NS74_GYMJU|nr:hypothetical protein CPB84DRAFT_1776689 [Gymnopilus junonius]